MSLNEIVLAWKDPSYRAALDQQILATLPPNPAGFIDLPDPALQPAAAALVTARPKRGQGRGLLFTYVCFFYSYQGGCSAYGDDQWLTELSLG